MTVEFLRIEDCHVVHKPWGTETWLMSGNDVYPFALKELILKAGFVTSLQVHQYKSESIHLHIGKGALAYHPKPFDCERFLADGRVIQQIARGVSGVKEGTPQAAWGRPKKKEK